MFNGDGEIIDVRGAIPAHILADMARTTLSVGDVAYATSPGWYRRVRAAVATSGAQAGRTDSLPRHAHGK